MERFPWFIYSIKPATESSTRKQIIRSDIGLAKETDSECVVETSSNDE
ncbi:hypothetical protein [Thalassotalea litorea]|nr:hypothetical protein [Thalassotalea litorea]